MGFEFLRAYGGRRLGRYPVQPLLEAPEPDGGAEGDDAETINRDFEVPAEEWRPIDVRTAVPADDETPVRFIDGCNVGQTVAWVQDGAGHPIPLRLAQIGGVCIRAHGRVLCREAAPLDRVVALIADPFPWAEIEGFAVALAADGYRMVPVAPPKLGEDDRRGLTFDFQRMHMQTLNGVMAEMVALEEAALCHDLATPTVVDGRLNRFRHGLSEHDVLGVVKLQHRDYLHPAGWRVLYRLEPGQRTPAFVLDNPAQKEIPVVSWFLKLAGQDRAMPNWGVVRVEYPLRRFHQTGTEFGRLDRLSHALYRIRCRTQSYARAAVSLEPIVRAEESLSALFCPTAMLAQHFYRMTSL